MCLIFLKADADVEVINLSTVKYDNGMYTTKIPDLIKDDELD